MKRKVTSRNQKKTDETKSNEYKLERFEEMSRNYIKLKNKIKRVKLEKNRRNELKRVETIKNK